MSIFRILDELTEARLDFSRRYVRECRFGLLRLSSLGRFLSEGSAVLEIATDSGARITGVIVIPFEGALGLVDTSAVAESFSVAHSISKLIRSLAGSEGQ